jgi:hypothetical protein
MRGDSTRDQVLFSYSQRKNRTSEPVVSTTIPGHEAASVWTLVATRQSCRFSYRQGSHLRSVKWEQNLWTIASPLAIMRFVQAREIGDEPAPVLGDLQKFPPPSRTIEAWL